jgi:hypothetical protein
VKLKTYELQGSKPVPSEIVKDLLKGKGICTTAKVVVGVVGQPKLNKIAVILLFGGR